MEEQGRAKSREGVAAVVKEAHAWSLKGGKQGKEEMLQERNRGEKMEVATVGGSEWKGWEVPGEKTGERRRTKMEVNEGRVKD